MTRRVAHAELQPRLERAFRTVPREAVTAEEVRPYAGLNLPLPAGRGVVSFSPRACALFLGHLDIQEGNTVLLATPDPYLAALAAQEVGADGEVVVACRGSQNLARRLQAFLKAVPAFDRIECVPRAPYSEDAFDRILLPEESGVLPTGARSSLRPMGVILARIPRGGRMELVRILHSGDDYAEMLLGELRAPEHPPVGEDDEEDWPILRFLAFEDALRRVWGGRATTPEEMAFAEAVDETWRDEPEGDASAEEWATARALFHVSYISLLAGDIETAEEGLESSLQVAESAEAYTFLGWTWSFRGLYQEAIAACLRAIQVDPEFGNPYNDVGAYLLEMGQPHEAETWLRRAMRAPRYGAPAYPWANFARARLMQGDLDGARQALLRAIELDPTYLAAWQMLDELDDE